MFSLSGKRATTGGRFACRVVILAILWLSSASTGSAQTLRGVALVIGNSTYEHISALPNPANDARAVENLLNSLGFETTLVSDRDARRLARDLDIFIEDAEGADVAVVYYAGHGLEAGGENFLVPVDADLSALEAAGQRLVPVSAFIEQLQASVPLAIVMLDACRDNPFPAGAMVRLDASSDPVPMAVAGLTETRGARQIRQERQAENFGTVITFAAEPGHAALDGTPGGNSPYAAAVLRHLETMAGEEFGTVMRMIGEEVYLKTSGRQRPWVNENLRRLLYFGRAPDRVEGEEGEILAERRQLLVTIAALPDFERRQVERVAEQGGVPMDAVFGMVRALGQDAPEDPAELEEMLRSQTERLKKIIAEREALKSMDAEIVRLAALADQAVGEGALTIALRLHERAKARVEQLEAMVEDAEADVRARRIEFAEVYARSAEAYALSFEHLQAARDYERAFEHVERWDKQLAWRYKRSEVIALTDHGNYRGDNAALERAIDVGRQAERIAEVLDRRDSWATTQNDLGTALWFRGERESGTARLEEAVVAYRAALEELTREHVPLDWAMAQTNLGNALQTLGERERGTVRLDEAVVAFRAALEERTRDSVPLDWAMTQNSLGAALWKLGEREGGTARLEEAVVAFRAALQERPRERVPLDWAMTQNNLGVALQTLGERERGTARLEEAVDAFRAALEELTRERVPLYWAAIQNNLGKALKTLGERESGTARLDEAADAFRAALEEWTRERVPLDWARAQMNLGIALIELGKRSANKAGIEEGRQALAAAWQVYREAGYTQYESGFQQLIAEADTALAALD